MNIRSLAFAAVTLISGVALAEGPKIYIGVDMEGMAGAVTNEQTLWGGLDYDRFRKLLTAEVNAAIDGAFDAGASKVTVADFHNHAQTLIYEDLNPKVMLIRGHMEGTLIPAIEDHYDGMVLI